MTKRNKNNELKYISDISDDDIFSAMKDIEGYLDITPGDFKELYFYACNHAAERLINSVTAKDIMTKEVIVVDRNTSLQKIAEMMESNSISGVPVMGLDNKVVGVISEKDFLFYMGRKKNSSLMGIISQCLSNKGCIALPINRKKAEDIMTTPPITVTETTSVAGIMSIFTEKNINRVPVLNEALALVGIVSRADVLKTPLSRVKE